LMTLASFGRLTLSTFGRRVAIAQIALRSPLEQDAQQLEDAVCGGTAVCSFVPIYRA
jgi:hypothetical protein